MNRIYDNGAIMLGNVKMVREEIQKENRVPFDTLFSISFHVLKI